MPITWQVVAIRANETPVHARCRSCFSERIVEGDADVCIDQIGQLARILDGSMFIDTHFVGLYGDRSKGFVAVKTRFRIVVTVNVAIDKHILVALEHLTEVLVATVTRRAAILQHNTLVIGGQTAEVIRRFNICRAHVGEQ